jgi:predicted RNA-binding protein with PIN domain
VLFRRVRESVEDDQGVINYPIGSEIIVKMNYIIDGHNLIGKIPGLSLSMPDDEERLIELLNRSSQGSRHKLEVYFDGAPPGEAGRRNYGSLRAHFVPASQTADDAIRRRLRRLGKSATSWVVVTSDHNIQAAAREAHAKVLRAEDFSEMVQTTLQRRVNVFNAEEKPLSEEEVIEWLAIFKERGN